MPYSIAVASKRTYYAAGSWYCKCTNISYEISIVFTELLYDFKILLIARLFNDVVSKNRSLLCLLPALGESKIVLVFFQAVPATGGSD